jgi:endonuclease G
MRSFLLLILLLPTLASAQLRDSVYVKNQIFETVYSEVLEQPKWVKYTVLCPDGNASRAGMDFFTNDSIKTSDGEDYAKNVYDKGHLAPAADFNCTKEMLKQTFSYLNCALQNQYLNRGVWRILEEYERELAKKETVIVTIYLVFNEKSVKLPTGATVPSGFYKIITLEKSKKTLKYYFPNESPAKPKFTDYQISLN